MFNPFKALTKGGAEGAQMAAADSIKAVKSARSAEKTRNLDVRLYDAYTNTNETTQGVMSNTNNFMLCPYTGGVFMDVKPMHENGRLIVQASKKYHKTIDMQKLDKICGAVAQKFNIKFTYADFVENIVIEDVHASYDLGLFDNKWSESFSSDSGAVLKSAILQLILDSPTRTILFIGIICALGGIIMGAIGMAGLAIILGWWL